MLTILDFDFSFLARFGKKECGRHAGAKEFWVTKANQKIGPLGEPFGPTIIEK